MINNYVEKKAAKISKRVNISNFAKLASQTTKLKEVRQNKQMQAARKKYNTIGEKMMPKNLIRLIKQTIQLMNLYKQQQEKE